MKQKKVNGYINPELPHMGKTTNVENNLPPINIPKTMAECKNAAERVLVYCVTLFQTTNTKYDKPDPYDQTIRVVRGRIKPNSQFDVHDMLPRGEGACDAFERDLNAFENEVMDDDYAAQWE